MKNKALYLTLVISFLMSICHTASAAPKCSLKTLKGTYIYGGTGMAEGAVSIEAGQDIFDGKGGIVNTYTDASGQTTVTKGTYVMNSNCIGESSYDGSDVSYAIYTGPKGEEISWVSATEGTKMGGREIRVSTSLTPKCSLKTLKGTYIYSQVGYKNGAYYVESGQEVYDGAGGIVNTFTDEKGNKVVTQASYTMDASCVGESAYLDTGDKYSIFAGPNGGEFRYVSEPGASKTLAAGAEHRVSKQLIK